MSTTLDEQIATAKMKAEAARAHLAACAEKNHEGSLDPKIAADLYLAAVSAKSACRVLDRELARLVAAKGEV
jgi:hypothetical protein